MAISALTMSCFEDKVCQWHYDYDRSNTMKLQQIPNNKMQISKSVHDLLVIYVSDVHQLMPTLSHATLFLYSWWHNTSEWSTLMYVEQGPISLRLLWANHPNLEIKILFSLEKWWSNLVTILHKSQQLSCRDMCKFVTWLDHIRIIITAKIIFEGFQLWAHKLFVKRVPRLSFSDKLPHSGSNCLHQRLVY